MYGNGFMMDLVAGAGTDGGMCLAPGEKDPNAIAAATEQTPAQEEEGGFGVMDLVHGALDLAGLVPGQVTTPLLLEQLPVLWLEVLQRDLVDMAPAGFGQRRKTRR